MNWRLTAGALLLAMAVTFGTGTYAADDPHQHGRQAAGSSSARSSAPPAQLSAPQSVPARGSAENMLKAMELMPAQDHDTCCTLAKPEPKTRGHNH
jgi:hypothetical protein